MDGQTVILRTDAGGLHGYGHIMRCIALADALAAAGAVPVFWSESLPENIHALLAKRAFPVITAPPDTTAAWLVVDSYTIGEAERTKLARAAARLAIIDDVGDNGPYACDLLINPNPGARTSSYGAAKQALIGADFVLLRRDILSAQTDRRSGSANRILVSCGGTDPFGITAKVLQAVHNLGDGIVRVLSNAADLDVSDKDRVQVVSGDFDMASHLLWADVAVLAAGSVQWEAAYLGCPYLALIVADNQAPGATFAAGEGASLCLDWRETQTVDALKTDLAALMKDDAGRTAQAQKAQALIDGRGAERVVRAMAQMV
ncbi:MAG: hypothetical protein AAF337_03880 [Pseudomonadota bacterium]